MRLFTYGAAAVACQISYYNFQYRRNKLQVETRSWWNPFGSKVVSSNTKQDFDKKEKKLREIRQKLVLYQFATCPFCNKVNVYLDYYGIPYSKVEVQPVPKTQMKWFKGKKKVPTLKIVEEDNSSEIVLQESSQIISLLHSYQFDKSKTETFQSLADHYDLITKSGKEMEINKNAKYTVKNYGLENSEICRSELEWRKWADEKLVHVIAPNIYRSMREALDSFRIITAKGNFGNDKWWATGYRICAEWFGASFMRLLSTKLRKKYNLNEDVRVSLIEYVNEWVAEVGDKKYHGGNSPNLADLAVYGTLKSMEDMDAFLDMLEHTKIGPWYARMQKVCAANSKLKSND